MGYSIWYGLHGYQLLNATLGFIADSGLRTCFMYDHWQLFKDFPLDELLSAADLDKIQESLTLIYEHIN